MKEVTVRGVTNRASYASGLADINPVTKELEVASSMSYCRAFAADSLFALKNKGITSRAPGYLTTWYPWTKGNIYALIEVPTMYKTHFLKNLSFLHSKEEKAGVAKSTMFKVNGKENIYMLKGSGHWKNKCWSQLLYTFYIKCMLMENPTALNMNGEAQYWAAIRKQDKDGISNETKLLKAVKMRKEIFSPTVFGNKLSEGVHDREGFVSICEGKNPPMEKLLGVYTGKSPEWFKQNIRMLNW